MTTYFDEIAASLRVLRHAESLNAPDYAGTGPTAEEIEISMVFDVTVASELQDFPEDLRDAIHRAVLKFGVATRPYDHPSTACDDDEIYASRRQLCEALHSIFHEVARRERDGLNDNPRAGLQMIFERGEQRREALAKKGPPT